MLQEIMDLFRAREPIPFVILAFICVGWVIILERLILLQFVYRINFTKFNQILRKMLAAGELDRARNFCKSTSKTGIPHLALKAIDTYESDTFRVRMVISEEALCFMPRVRRRISQLPSLATCAILLGALASVHGIWQSFNAANVLEMGMKSLSFTRGLSTALNPLALSLAAAVLLMLPYGLIEAIATRLEGEMEHSLTVLLNLLAPEGQMAPVHAGVPTVNVVRAHAEPASDNDHSSEPVASHADDGGAKKGGYDEVPSGSEPVLDEEEII